MRSAVFVAVGSIGYCALKAYAIALRPGGNHATDRAESLLRAGERPREDEEVLLRGARLRGDAPADLPLPRVLARGEWKDPGAHGPRRYRQRRPLLSRHAEGRRDRSRRRRGPHRLRGDRARWLHPALQGARGQIPAAIASRVRSLPDLRQGPEWPHHRVELLRAQGREGLGRRRLLEDAAGGRDAGVTKSHSFADVAYDEAMARARALVPTLRERADGAEVGREMQKETLEDLHRTGLLRFHQPKRWG